ncbi:MAG: TRAP transporter substrate-binding protein [Alphaproteobacteria bacterium]
MNKLTRFAFALAAASALSLPVAAQDLPATKFNVVGSIGNLSIYTQMEQPFWSKTIPEKSNGKIQVEAKPFTELGLKGGEIFRLVGAGTVPMATTVLNYNSGDMPINEAADLVGLVGSVEELQKLADIVRPVLAKEYETKHKIKLLGFGSYHAQIIYCRDKIAGLADIKGKKVRAAGASQHAFVQYLGGSPLNIAFAEVQPALAKGVVDCAITGALSGYRSKWHEAATHLLPVPVNFGLVATIANLEWWNKLDPKVQAFLAKEIRELENNIFKLAATETAMGIICNTGTGGQCSVGPAAKMTLVPVSAADQALRQKAFSDAILPDFAKRCGAACVAEWNATIGKAMGIVAKAN